MTEYVNGNQTKTFGREIILPSNSHTILQLGIVCAMRCTGYIEEHCRIVSCWEWLTTGNKPSAKLGCFGVIYSMRMTDDRRTRVPTPRSLCKRPAPMRGSLFLYARWLAAFESRGCARRRRWNGVGWAINF